MLKARDGRFLKGKLILTYRDKAYKYTIRKGGIALDWWRFPVICTIMWKDKVVRNELLTENKYYRFIEVIEDIAELRIKSLKVGTICRKAPSSIVTLDWELRFIEPVKKRRYKVFYELEAELEDGKVYDSRQLTELFIHVPEIRESYPHRHFILLDGWSSPYVNFFKLKELKIRLYIEPKDAKPVIKEWKKRFWHELLNL